MCIWLTADSHYGHANILEYCHRDFASIEEHDEALIDAWNSVVGKDDDVYHLGDFTLHGINFADDLFARLNGKIRVLGYPWHHDTRWLPGRSFGASGYESHSGYGVLIEPPMVVLEDVATNADGRGVPMTLCHYPLAQFDRGHYGGMHAHGHSHGNEPRIPGRLDVGVDSAFQLVGEYRPLRLEECVSMIRSWKKETIEPAEYTVSFYGNDGYCLNCKQPLEGASCPYCGWDDDRPAQHKHLSNNPKGDGNGKDNS